MIYRICHSWQMGGMRSNSGLFYSKAVPNLCIRVNGEHRWEWDDGQPELSPTLRCAKADPDKELAGILSHSWGDDISLPSVVGVYQVAKGGNKGDSWTLESLDSTLLGTELTSFLLSSSVGEEQGIWHEERRRTHLLSTDCMHTLYYVLSDFSGGELIPRFLHR